MGNAFTKGSGQKKDPWYTKFFDPNDIQITLIGLDGAGKSTLLSTLKPDDTEIQYKLGSVQQLAIPQVNNIKLNVMAWPLQYGGRCSLRIMWGHFFKYTDGLIFMMDSANMDMLDYIKAELDRVLEMDALDGKPILVIANKQDLDNACSADEIAEKLDLQSIKNREWHICGTVATKGDGINEGMDWLSNAIQRKNPRIEEIKPEIKETKPAKPAGLGYIKNGVVSLKNVFCGKGA